MAVLVALVIGVMLGLLARPVLDAYLSWKTAVLWRDSKVQRSDRGASLVMPDDISLD